MSPEWTVKRFMNTDSARQASLEHLRPAFKYPPKQSASPQWFLERASRVLNKQFIIDRLREVIGSNPKALQDLQ